MFINPVYQRPIDPKSHLKKIPKWIKHQFNIQPTQQLIPEDQDYIYRALVEVLKYPDKKLADLHMLANRLGKNDLKSSKAKGDKQQTSYQDMNQSKQNIVTEDSINDDIPLQSQTQGGQQFCQCCGFVKQKQTISVCVSFQQFPTIGLSTFLYFRTIINCIIMLIILFVIYSAFEMFINYYIYVESLGLSVFTGSSVILGSYDTIFSYKSIELNFIQFEQRIIIYTRIGAILIMVVVVVWSFIVYLFKHYQVEYQEMIDDESATASDFAIVIEDAPIQLFKDFSNIQIQFTEYFRSILPTLQKQYFDIYLQKPDQPLLNRQQQLRKLRVSKINIGIPFYLNQNNLESDEQYKLMCNELEDNQQKLVEWAIQFFNKKKLTVKEQYRQKRLQDYQFVKQKIQNKKQSFLKALQAQYKSQLSYDQITTTVFVTFQSAIAAKIVYELNPNSLMQRILSCCNSQKKFVLRGKQNRKLKVKIQRAPQPEDIIWQNIGFSFGKILLRRLFTYAITIGILVGSFFLITYLSMIQLHSDNFFIGIAISFSITVLNIVIGLVIHELTVFQKDFTHTHYQASLSLKSVFAQLINSIMIPVMIKQDNIYGKAGLVEDAFWLVITSSLIDPLLKFIDFYYFYTRIRYLFKLRPYSKLGVEQDQLNEFAQKMEFQAGFQYIYTTNLFLITCFFTPIQPIIPIISIIGLFLMYWAQKYSLLNRMKRPIPGSDMINVTMGSMITLGPIMLVVGAIVFSDLLSKHGEGNLKFLLHMISVGIGVFFYILPFKLIYRCIFSEDEVFDNLIYFQNRILLPSEYDRFNPATTQQGMDDFMKYLKQINDVFTNQSINGQNQSGNNRLVTNLAKFVQKSQKNPHSKQAENLKNAAAQMQNNSVLNSLFGPKHLRPAVHGMNQGKKNSLAIQFEQKVRKPQTNKVGTQKNFKSQELKTKAKGFENLVNQKPKVQQKQQNKEQQNQTNQSQFLRQRKKKTITTANTNSNYNQMQNPKQNKNESKQAQKNQPFVKQVDELNQLKIFQKPVTKIGNPFEFNEPTKKSPQKKQQNQGIFGMQMKPYRDINQKYNDFGMGTSQGKPKQQTKKFISQSYHQLQNDSPVRQKGIGQRAERQNRFNFIKIKNIKAPKRREQQGYKIHQTQQDLSPGFGQVRNDQKPIRINLDRNMSPNKNSNYNGQKYPHPIFVSPVKNRQQNNTYQQRGNNKQRNSNNSYVNNQQINHQLHRKRKSVSYRKQSNSNQYLSNHKLNNIQYKSRQNEVQQNGMQFNGYSIDYQRQRRKNSKNNPYQKIINKNKQINK